MSESKPWLVGQSAVINRATIVTIERVTPSGRVVANGQTFEPDGRERSGRDPYRRSQIEPLTAEIQAEMDLILRGRKASLDASKAVDAADEWLRWTFGMRGSVPEVADVERAEKLSRAIRQMMETPNAK